MKKLPEISKKEVLKNNTEKYANFEAQKLTCKKTSKSKNIGKLFLIIIISSNFFKIFDFFEKEMIKMYSKNIITMHNSPKYTPYVQTSVATSSTPKK